MKATILALALILPSVVVAPDGTIVDWNVDASGGAINIDASNSRWEGYPGPPGNQSGGAPASGVGYSPGGNARQLESLSLDQLCDMNHGSNTGVSYFESGLMSGPLAEYCLYRKDQEPTEDETPAEKPAARMTVADLGYYVQANAQSIIDGGVLSLQPASGEVVINKAVYFASSARRYTASVAVLGTPVELAFTPKSFEWLPGDGSSFVTGDPGGPYPDGGVTYSYARPGTYVPGVRVGWEVLIRVAGSGWYPVPGEAFTVVQAQPVTAVEAEAVLTTNR